MKIKIFIGLGLVAVLLIGFYLYTKNDINYEPNQVPVSGGDDQEIRRVVTEFGTQIQKVSLLAPTASRKLEMDAVYKAYVAPELLNSWYEEGADALGRYSSSPWPERIEIIEVREMDENNYVVEGNVIEVTSAEAGTSKSAAAIYPVTLTLEKRGETWMIVKSEKGRYTEMPRIQTIVGFWECLPHKDTSGPQTMECAFGIAVDQSDGHYAVDTSLMSVYPVDYATGTKVRITGIITPVEFLSSIQKYNIDGIIRATVIEEI